MQLEIVTKEDLQLFRQQLLEDLQRLLRPAEVSKKWLRSKDVRRILNISPGTLQNFRINNTLHARRLPNSTIWYYDPDEINELLTKITNGNNEPR